MGHNPDAPKLSFLFPGLCDVLCHTISSLKPAKHGLKTWVRITISSLNIGVGYCISATRKVTKPFIFTICYLCSCWFIKQYVNIYSFSIFWNNFYRNRMTSSIPDYLIPCKISCLSRVCCVRHFSWILKNFFVFLRPILCLCVLTYGQIFCYSCNWKDTSTRTWTYSQVYNTMISIMLIIIFWVFYLPY